MDIREMIDRLENYYGFRCEDGGALRDCLEWQQLRSAALAASDQPWWLRFLPTFLRKEER